MCRTDWKSILRGMLSLGVGPIKTSCALPWKIGRHRHSPARRAVWSWARGRWWTRFALPPEGRPDRAGGRRLGLFPQTGGRRGFTPAPSASRLHSCQADEGKCAGSQGVGNSWSARIPEVLNNPGPPTAAHGRAQGRKCWHRACFCTMSEPRLRFSRVIHNIRRQRKSILPYDLQS
jgi:hypothetical protein